MQFATYSSRGQTQVFSGKLEKSHYRSMGLISDKGRLQTRIASKTSVFRHNLNKCSKTTGRYYFRRNNFSFRERCYRKGSISREKSRFLQYLISGKEKEWQNETSYKSQTTKSIPMQETFQNGYACKSIEFSTTKRLGSVNRSERRLPTHTNFSKSQKVPEVLFSRSMLPMESNVFWANSSSESVHKNSLGGCSLLEINEHKTSSIFRRLAKTKSTEESSSSKPKHKSTSSDRSRFCNKSRKIQSSSSTNFHLHRSLVQSQESHCKPNTRKIREITTVHYDLDNGTSNSMAFPEIARTNCILYRTDSKCSPVHEACSVASAKLLESIQRPFRQDSSNYSTSKISSPLVAKFSQHYEGSIITPVSGRSDSHDRCIEGHVRGTFGRQLCTGLLDRGTVERTHKSVRNEGCFSLSEAFPTQGTRENCSSKVRQHISSSIHSSPGGDPFEQIVHRSMESVAFCTAESYIFEGSAFAWNSEPPSRSIESLQNQGDRVDARQDCGSKDFSEMGQATDGFVCFTSEQSDPNILFMVPEHSSFCNRCSQHFLGEHVCLCISPNVPDSKDSETYTAVPLSNYFDNTPLAEEVMVSRSAGPSNSSASKASTHSKFVGSTKHSNSTSKSTNVKSNSLAVVDKRFQKIGFSKRARNLLMEAWRTGTRKDYSSKFRQFESWCSERQIDPYCSSIIQIVDFLTYLYHKGLQYSTINGYRSMLSAVLPCIEGYKVGQHPYVIQLLKGVFNARPPQARLVPEWDLLKVLNALQKRPFEPLSKASLKLITMKTVFMIAISSFRRCSDLQSFRIGPESVNIQSKGITFIRHGLAKQDRQSHRRATVFIPAFPDNKKLDPKRCMYYYLKATEKYRRSPEGADETKVFLGLNEPHRPVSSQTISHWIVETLRFTLNDKEMKVKAHSTRALGPSLALFRGASVESIMNSADWSSETTFTRFYLRDMNCNVFKEKH